MKTAEYRQRSLRVHRFLDGVPMHSLDVVELPGGAAGMDLAEISGVIGFGGDAEVEIGPLTRGLFALRGWVGRILRWDDHQELTDSVTYLRKLSDADRGCSRVPPGKAAGISRILYQFEHEMLAEIVNRTVHCFWVLASEPTATGYRLWIAVYVKRLNWFTPIYMALISPLLRWIIYPAMRKAMREHWEAAFPSGGGSAWRRQSAIP
jgi:hypothetical protein